MRKTVVNRIKNKETIEHYVKGSCIKRVFCGKIQVCNPECICCIIPTVHNFTTFRAMIKIARSETGSFGSTFYYNLEG